MDYNIATGHSRWELLNNSLLSGVFIKVTSQQEYSALNHVAHEIILQFKLRYVKRRANIYEANLCGQLRSSKP